MKIINATKHTFHFLNGKYEIVNSSLKENVIDVLEKKVYDIVILDQDLKGKLNNREFVLTLRVRFPTTRIIYILNYNSPREKGFLYHWCVFDVLIEGVYTNNSLEDSIKNPKKFSDIASTYATYGSSFNLPSEKMLEKYSFLESSLGFKERNSVNDDNCYYFSYKIENAIYDGVIRIPFDEYAYTREITSEFELVGNVKILDRIFKKKKSVEEFETLVKKCEEIFWKEHRIKKAINGIKMTR